MSTVHATAERSVSNPDISTATVSPQPQASRPQRVLACVLCQQRKVKCDRKFPCVNCIKSRTQCVPATLATRRRRRKFPDRELLERLRKYENLLRQNNIKFEPLSKDKSRENEPPNAEGAYDSDDDDLEAAEADRLSPSTTIKSERVYETKDMWRALNQGFQDPENDSDSSHDDATEFVFTKAWNELADNDDHLLLGSRKTAVELSTLHPEPAQIFKLWQIYLENVNPLLKVTHTPSLQGRIVDAVSNVTAIDPILEALMFSIYCTAISSLVADAVQPMFNSSKEDLLSTYQFGCRQALLNCAVLRSGDRDCLTALYLYLVSARTNTVPRSLSSMLGVALRIAERMGIHNESDLAKCSPLEAEMRRRLWWSLVLFDTRIGELAFSKTTKLVPTWDCRVPLNVNDSELRPEMKELPEVLGKSTEALFAVVRGELGEFIRNTMFYLDFTAPVLKPIAKDLQNGPIPEGGELVTLEKMIEDKYLKSCDPENPLDFMTIWSARGFLSKYYLVEHHSKYSSSSVHQTEVQLDTVISHALKMLECDTKLMTSPLTKGFLWQILYHFPFPAYNQIVQDLRRRPINVHAEQAWAVMSDNYRVRFGFGAMFKDDSPVFQIFAKIVLQAWEARELAFGQLGEPLTPPKFVSTIRHRMAQAAQSVRNEKTEQLNDGMGMGVDDFLMSMPMDFSSQMYGLVGQTGYTEMGSGAFPHMPGLAPLDVDVSHLDWSAMNWSSMNEPAGQGELYSYIPGKAPFDADMNQLDSSGGLDFGG